MTVVVMRTEHTAADLCRPVGQSDDAAVTRRLRASVLVVAGCKRADAARLSGTWQALRNWVHSYNLDGVAALPTGTAAGPSGARLPSRREVAG